MANTPSRSQTCGSADARRRIAQAHALVSVAELIHDDTSDIALPSVAASLCVLSGIAASDAACCAALGKRPRGQDHMEAAKLLKTVSPGGSRMAKDLLRLLAAKDESHYGLSLITAAKAQSLIRTATRLANDAQRTVDAYP